MSRTTRGAMALLTLSILLLGSRAADGAETPAAPVPAAILAAKKVFISNAGQEVNPRAGATGVYNGGPNRAYDQFYAALKGWGKYDLVGSPAEADLVLEIGFNQPIVWGKWADGTFADDAHFRLVILDPKTRIALWVFTEHVEPANMQSNRDKNFDKALQKTVKDIQELGGKP